MSHAEDARLVSRLRRAAAKHDLQIHKSRCRTPEHLDYGGYMLTSLSRGWVVAGGEPFAFSLSLDDLTEEIQARIALA